MVFLTKIEWTIIIDSHKCNNSDILAKLEALLLRLLPVCWSMFIRLWFFQFHEKFHKKTGKEFRSNNANKYFLQSPKDDIGKLRTKLQTPVIDERFYMWKLRDEGYTSSEFSLTNTNKFCLVNSCLILGFVSADASNKTPKSRHLCSKSINAGKHVYQTFSSSTGFWAYWMSSLLQSLISRSFQLIGFGPRAGWRVCVASSTTSLSWTINQPSTRSTFSYFIGFHAFTMFVEAWTDRIGWDFFFHFHNKMAKLGVYQSNPIWVLHVGHHSNCPLTIKRAEGHSRSIVPSRSKIKSFPAILYSPISLLSWSRNVSM